MSLANRFCAARCDYRKSFIATSVGRTIADLQKVGERIQQAQDSYNEARKKFSEGSGNVVRQAEMLKQLGVKSSKTLPAQWVEPAMEEPVGSLVNQADLAKNGS